MSEEPAPGKAVAVDRRGKRGERRKGRIPVALDRRARERRGSSQPESVEPGPEFSRAMDQYKRDNARPFPTWSEVLEVVNALGYRKVSERSALPGPPPPAPASARPEDAATVDRRGGADRRKRQIPVAIERRKGDRREERPERRRQVDPTTCERDYTDDEIEFMRSMDQYKRDNRRPFPTWDEVLAVIQSLGYRKAAERTALPGLSPAAPPKG